ncbi:unnamed protein product [Moneuplotes crassus]|uniref:Cyclic nucleotide-binding domain-containing protein n=1 Tax=Euplotes crassus TaxID=5936 RepID=A0AAD1UP61_EUPCR|nr:unnamed protein product [Moneuplotes crassus]
MEKIKPLPQDLAAEFEPDHKSSVSHSDNKSSVSKMSSNNRESVISNNSPNMKTGRALKKPMKENPFLFEQSRQTSRKSFIVDRINSFASVKKFQVLPPIVHKPKISDNNVGVFGETKTPPDGRSEDKEGSSHDQEKSGCFLVSKNSRKLLAESSKILNASIHDCKADIIDKLEMFSEDEQRLSNPDERNKKCIFRAHLGNRLRWEIFIILLAIWNGFSIPYSVAFLDPDRENIGWVIVNSLTDFMFFLDVVINCRTTFIDEKTSEEIFDPKLILKQYLKGRFWLDIIASLPFDLIAKPFLSGNGDSSLFQMLGILKLIRILRLSRLMSFMNLKDHVKMSLKLFRLLFFIILYIHFIACLLFFFRKENSWLPPLEYGWKDEDLFQASTSRQYTTSLYHSMLVLAGNDIAPSSDLAFILQTTLLLLSSIINASIFGNLAVLLQQMNLKAAQLQEKVENANSTMKSLRIPEDIQDEVNMYIMNTHNNIEQQNELDTFLSQLSPSLQLQIRKAILKDVISQNDVFEGCDGAISFILRDLSILLFQPESMIIRQGSEAEEMYFIAHGACSIYVNDETKGEILVNQIKEGEYFGEVALIKECKRTATVKSSYYTTCAGYHKTHLYDLFGKYKFIKTKMEKKIHKNYQDKWKKFMITALRNIVFLENSTIPDEVIEEITYKVKTVTFTAGASIFKQNEKCSDIIIVASGEISVSINNNQVYDIELDTLYSGCTIGSYSILNQDDHSISTAAKTDCSVILISSRILESLASKFEEISRSIEEHQEYLKQNGLPFLDYRIYRTKKSNMTAKQKFQNGIKRITKIVRSYKIDDIQGLLIGHRKMLLDRKKKHANTMKAKQSEQLRFIKDEAAMTNVKINTILELVTKQSSQISELQKEIKKLRGQNKPGDSNLTSRDLKEDDSCDSSSGSSSVLSDGEYEKKKIIYQSKRVLHEDLPDNDEELKEESSQNKSNTRGLDFSNNKKRRSSSLANIRDPANQKKFHLMSGSIVGTPVQNQLEDKLNKDTLKKYNSGKMKNNILTPIKDYRYSHFKSQNTNQVSSFQPSP